MSDQTPAGWYPDPEQIGQQRYWDGSEWTDNRAPGTQSPPVKKGGVPTGAKVLIGVVGVLALMVACGALLSGGGDSDAPSAQATQTAEATDQGATKAETPEEETAPPEEETAPPEEQPEEPTLTVSQENALGSAEDYLSYSAFSRSGLIEQLEYEGYSKKDATFAVDNVEVDWNEQAAKSAEQYLEYSNFPERPDRATQVRGASPTSRRVYGADSVGL